MRYEYRLSVLNGVEISPSDCLCTHLSLHASFAVMMTIRLRSCWRGAGLCSGSRWPLAGSVSSSTSGLWLLPWSARSVLRPEMLMTPLGSGSSDSWDVGRHKLARWAKGPPQPPFTLKHNSTLPSALGMEDYLLPFVLYASVCFYVVWQC